MTMQRDVLDDEITFGNQMVIFHSDIWAEVVLDDRQDLLQPIPALGASRMIHQVASDQFVKNRVITI